MKRKICYIINPISGTKSKDTLSNLVAKETLKAGIAFQFFPSVASGDYSFLFDTITEEHYTDVVIIGGDGTVNQVVDSLKHLPVRFGIIPSGSGNGLAFSAGIPKTPLKALKIIFKNQWTTVDGFRIRAMARLPERIQLLQQSRAHRRQTVDPVESPGEGRGGGLVAGEQEGEQFVVQFVVGEALALLVAAGHQQAEHVVSLVSGGQGLASLGHLLQQQGPDLALDPLQPGAGAPGAGVAAEQRKEQQQRAEPA